MTDGKRLIGDRYEILRSVDEGGTSYIFLVRDIKLDKQFAMKLLKPELFYDKAYAKAFKKEVNILKKLRHPGIIHMVNYGAQGSFTYYVMDYISGKSLKNYIENDLLTLEQKVEIAIKLCEAMEYAHNAGVIHQDLKSANVVINQDGDPVLLDFGTAQAQETVEAAKEEIFGTAEYISPEQAKGEKTDKRSDIYSMGILLYELMTGTLPFTGEDTVSVALKHIHQEPVEPCGIVPELPISLQKIILKALRKQKSERYNSFAQMRRDLEKALDQPDGAYIKMAAPKPLQNKAEQKKKKTIGFWIFGSIAVALLLTVLLSFFLSVGDQKKEVYMPSLQNKTLVEAKEICEQYDLYLRTTYMQDEEIPAGYIIAQNPQMGAIVEAGDVVNVDVSLGIGGQLAEMPGLLGETKESAENWLNQLGFTQISFTYTYQEGVADEIVLAQYPEQGEQVPQDETIILEINRKQSQLAESIPNLVGLELTEAVRQAKEAGFERVQIECIDMTSSPGLIATQYPTSDMVEVSLEVMELGVQAPSSSWICKPVLDPVPLEFRQDAYINIVATFMLENMTYEFILEKYTCKDETEFREKFAGTQQYQLRLDTKFKDIQYGVCIYLNGDVVYTK